MSAAGELLRGKWLLARAAIALAVIVPAFGQAGAAVVEYELTVSTGELNFTGKPVTAMTVNGTVPGPVLRFKEGDSAIIRVTNKMEVETSIHWHGLLVPPGMDGVPLISFPPIKPGETFTYQFPIRQSGTYWYHSHTGLQEQRGVYGGIVIEPAIATAGADADRTLLFSDWTDEEPGEVFRTLKRGSEWYGLEKGSAQTLLGAARAGKLGDYFRRELLRMPPMDISDIAYDRFLVNGKTEVSLPAAPGAALRLRFINGGAGTNFLLEYAGGPLTIVAADGQEVEPLEVKRLFHAIAETYDVLVRAPKSGSYELRATAHDDSGYTSVWVGEGVRHPAPDVPAPDLYNFMGKPTLKNIFALTPAGSMGMADRLVKAGMFDKLGLAMAGMEHGGGQHEMTGGSMASPAAAAGGMSGHDMHSGHEQMAQSSVPEMKMMPEKPQAVSRSARKYGSDFRLMAGDASTPGILAVDGMDERRPWPPYTRLRSAAPADSYAGRTVRELRFTLDGDMERYVWLLNNKALSESDDILVKKGERVRFILINRTMMHHPMHLHGHFFRVINGQGERSPLKHTVNAAPMSTTVIEFDADELGDWFFHCHLLYHMKGGMARVLHYEGFDPGPLVSPLRKGLYKDHWYAWGQAGVLTNMSDGLLRLANTRSLVSAEWEAGWQKTDGTQWEWVVSYSRYINRFFSVFSGVDMLRGGAEPNETRGVAGFSYLLPLNIESRWWADADGGGRANLFKALRLAPRLTLAGELQYDSRNKWEEKVKLSYLLRKNIKAIGQWNSDYGFGCGVQAGF